MEAAWCQLGNLLTFPHLHKWTVSLLIRYPPRGQMSALLMAFLSSSLPMLLTAVQRSGSITSWGSARGAAPLPAGRHLPSDPHPRPAASPSSWVRFARIFS